jgi:hypothetical protein
MSVKHHSAIFLLAGLLLFAAGCSDNPVATGELCIEFTATSQANAGTVTSRLGTDSQCAAAAIEIMATDITDVFAFQSHITYDPDVVVFGGYSTVGSVLEEGSDVAVLVEEEALGELRELTIGASRVAPAVGIDVDGSGLVITLFFSQSALQATSGDLTLGEPCLLGYGVDEPLPKAGVACSGGTIRLR